MNLKELRELKSKYSVSCNGNKKYIANCLVRVRGHAMDVNDLRNLLPLLEGEQLKQAEKIVGDKNTKVKNYRGMWSPMEDVEQMTRTEIIARIKKFRNAWEKITGRSEDLNDLRLDSETLTQLKKHLKYYYSETAKNIAETYLTA